MSARLAATLLRGVKEHTTKRDRGEERQRGDKGESGERKKIIFL